MSLGTDSPGQVSGRGRAAGRAAPEGRTRRLPAEDGLIAVTFTASPRASAGMPQDPVAGKARGTPAASGVEVRVSTRRQGVTVWKSAASAAGAEWQSPRPESSVEPSIPTKRQS